MSEKETQMLSEIAVKVGRLEVLQESNAKAINEMAASVNRLVEKLDRSDDIAREADQRSKSAHHRIDETNKRIDELKSDMDGIHESGNWLPKLITSSVITTIIGGVIGAALTNAFGG